jgi:hypothetical protein
MKAVTYRLRADMRRSWVGALALAAVIAVLGGVVLACAAGARRTSSAYPRMVTQLSAIELLVGVETQDRTVQDRFYRAVGELAGVRAVAPFAIVGILPVDTDPFATERFTARASVDGTGFFEVDRPKLLAGRMPDPRVAEEVLADVSWARATGIGPGDVVDARVVPEDEFGEQGSVRSDVGEPVQLRVTGVGVRSSAVVPFDEFESQPGLVGGPALFAMALEVGSVTEAAGVDVETGAESRILADADAIAESLGTRSFLLDQTAARGNVSDAIRPLTASLAIFAAALALAALLVVGQALARHVELPQAEVSALAAVGMGRQHLRRLALLRALLIGSLGAVGAVLVAVGLSPRFPVGLARVAEPDPGMHVDFLVCGAGFVGIVAAALVVLVPSLRHRTASDAVAARPGPVERAAAAVGLGVAPAIGLRFALSRNGARPLAVRGTVIVAASATVALLAAATFATSLDDLLDHPDRYGHTWDVLADGGFGPGPAGLLLDRFEDDPRVRGIGAGTYGELTVDREVFPALTFAELAGEVSLRVVDGRLATRPGEVALGAEALERMRVDVGDDIEADPGDGPRRFEVVGRVVFPDFNQGSFVVLGLGLGAQLAPGELVPTSLPTDEEIAEDSGIDIETVAAISGHDDRRWNFVVVDAATGGAGVADDVQAAIDAVAPFWLVRTEQVPKTVQDLSRVRRAPSTLAGVFVALAAGVLAHGLLGATRDRRRELAVLRALGLRPRGARAAIHWQAATVATVATLVGVPLGVAAGRTLWRVFADGINADAPAGMPWPWIVAAPLAGVFLALAVAAIPAWRAGGIRPAVALRSEQ